MAPIKKGAKGDLVVWAQEHLISAGYRIGVDGGFGPNTRRAVLGFQRARGLGADGIIGPATWSALLRYRAVYIKWNVRGTMRPAAISDAGGRRSARAAPVPASASIPAKRDEISGRLGCRPALTAAPALTSGRARARRRRARRASCAGSSAGCGRDGTRRCGR